MSLVAITWAWEQPLPPRLKITLLALADHHNGETGQCNPSIERLAMITQADPRTVKRHLATLEKLGLIERQRVQHGFRQSTAQKHLNLGMSLTQGDTAVSPAVGVTTDTRTGSRTGIAEPEGEELRSSPRRGAVEK